MLYTLLMVCVFGISLTVTGFTRRFALERALLDIPNIRSSHKEPTPKGGGVVFVGIFLVFLAVLAFLNKIEIHLFIALFVSSALVSAVGLWDDVKGVGVFTRLGAHVFSSLWLLYWSRGSLLIPRADWPLSLRLAELSFMVFFLVWLTNLYNFMDGIDGIASIEAVCVAGFCSVVFYWAGMRSFALLMCVLTVSVAGFLWWNWPPAKIFMGDTGSGFLGFIFGAFMCIASQNEKETVWMLGILLSVFIVDATVTLFRRVLRGSVWFKAHKCHAYQYAARRWGHKKVTVTVAAINIFLLFPLAFLGYKHSAWGVWLALCGFIILFPAAYMLKAGIET